MGVSGGEARPSKNEAWIYDPSTTRGTTPRRGVRPSARREASMAYDSRRDRMILFGGFNNITGYLRDTWTYDIANTTWTNVTPGTMPPGAREGAGMVYDTVRDRVFLFGGDGPAGYYGDTNEYNPTTTSWAGVTFLRQPSPRTELSMTHDARTHRSLLFGGISQPGFVLHNDTWILDPGTTAGWTNVATTGPSGRYGAAMAYDARADVTILFGGNSFRAGAHNDTWAYNATTNRWTDRGQAPSPRYGYAWADDARAHSVVLFGGSDQAGTIFGDTWAYDPIANLWTNLTRSGGPTGRTNAAMAYDSRADRFVLFGGDTGMFTLTSETWIYDLANTTWSMSPPSLVRPAARVRHAMVYDVSADRVILFGGFVTGIGDVSDTWAYDFAFSTWTDRMPNPTPSPNGLESMGLAYDPRAGRTVLYGGTDVFSVFQNETWTYDYGTNAWTNALPAGSPGRRTIFGIAYDVRADPTILFGELRSAPWASDAV